MVGDIQQIAFEHVHASESDPLQIERVRLSVLAVYMEVTGIIINNKEVEDEGIWF